MKNIFYNILKLILTFGLIYSCSPTRNTFTSRNMNALGTKYNVLYNGKIAFDNGLASLDKGYKDNFYARIPIEPLKAKVLKPSFNINSGSNNNNFGNFNRAEEKAVKAIQKHGMTIQGVEYNKQIDEAYLLLGKARYYTRRFVPALDAFNHTINNDSKANLIYETKLWQAKTEIRLQNELVAINKLETLIKYNPLPPNIIAGAQTAIAMAYNQIDSTQEVINHLKLATVTNKNQIQNARNLIVLGQIYREKSEIDSSNLSFNKLLSDNKAPYKFRVQAQIEIAKNYNPKKDSVGNLLLNNLKKMVKDYDNEPYLGALYYVMADIEHKNQNDKEAKNYYNLSLADKSSDKIQKLLNYEQLGNLNFDEKNYVVSGNYYDSIINLSKNKNSKKLRQIKRKRNKLNDVILFDGFAQRDDSILRIVSLDNSAQINLFKKHIAYLKLIEKDSIEQALIKLQQQKLEVNSFIGANASKSSFYFYNTQLVGFGKQEFQKIWGNRKLADNWLYSDNSNIKLSENIVAKDSVQIKVNPKYKLNFYLSKIPNTKKEIDSITKQRNNAYFELGVIYKEQFKDYPLAIHYLDSLLDLNPIKSRILPTHFHLFKIYDLTDSIKANSEKDFIITNYPNSRYAKILLNPNKYITFNAKTSPESKYKIIYNDYLDKKYLLVDSLATKAIETYQGLPIIPKLKLLKAYAVIKLDGYKKFNKLATEIAQDYPTTDEGKLAKKSIKYVKSKLAKADDFTTKSNNRYWLKVYQVPNDFNLNKLENKIRSIIYDEEFNNLQIEQQNYNRTTKFLIIKGFSSKYSTKDFTDYVQKKYKKVMPKGFFVISQFNFNKIQLLKNLNDYLNTINKPLKN